MYQEAPEEVYRGTIGLRSTKANLEIISKRK